MPLFLGIYRLPDLVVLVASRTEQQYSRGILLSSEEKYTQRKPLIG